MTRRDDDGPTRVLDPDEPFDRELEERLARARRTVDPAFARELERLPPSAQRLILRSYFSSRLRHEQTAREKGITVAEAEALDAKAWEEKHRKASILDAQGYGVRAMREHGIDEDTIGRVIAGDVPKAALETVPGFLQTRNVRGLIIRGESGAATRAALYAIGLGRGGWYAPASSLWSGPKPKAPPEDARIVVIDKLGGERASGQWREAFHRWITSTNAKAAIATVVPPEAFASRYGEGVTRWISDRFWAVSV